MQTHNWYAVISAEILLRKDISSTEKLLVALISNLSNQKGYCFATNSYLAECLDISERQIQQCIRNLEELKILTRVLKLDANGELEYRALTIIGMNISGGDAESSMGGNAENCIVGGDKNCTIITKGINNKEDNKQRGGVIPELHEVQAYCTERGNDVDPHRWYDFYSSKGWMIGKNKMKDWRAAVRTWEKQNNVKPQTPIRDDSWG